MHFAALLLAVVTPIKPAELIRFVPDSARNLMLLNIEGSTLFPFDKLVEPLDEVLPFDARALIGGIRPLVNGAIAIASGGKALASLAVVHMEEDWTQTIFLHAPNGAAGKQPPATAWEQLVLDERTFALVSSKNAAALASAVKARKVGRPRALGAHPFSASDGLIAEIRSTPARRENIDEATIVIRGSKDGALTFTLALRCARGKGKQVASQLRAVATKASGRVAEVYKAGAVEQSGDVVRASYAIPVSLASAITFSR